MMSELSHKNWESMMALKEQVELREHSLASFRTLAALGEPLGHKQAKRFVGRHKENP